MTSPGTTREVAAGMSFTFTDEQNELRHTAKRFVDAELRPIADSIDKNHAIPRSLIDKMAELGFLGVAYPEEYDGAGMGEMGYCILQEEISRACASTATLIGAHQSVAGGVSQAFALPGEGLPVVVQPALQHAAFVGGGRGFGALSRHTRILTQLTPHHQRIPGRRPGPAAAAVCFRQGPGRTTWRSPREGRLHRTR